MANPFTLFTSSNTTELASALLAPDSGVSINASSIVLHTSGSDAVNFYDGSLTALGIGAGLLLTTGTTPGTSNTTGWFGQDNSVWPDTYYNGDANIDAVVNTVFQTQSFDATTLSFDFTVADPTATSVSFDLVFGSEEFPEWVDQFVDCAVVMVNGVNYALFNHDPLHPLSVVSSNLAAGYFQDNAVDPATGLSLLPIEYDGVSHLLKIVAPIIGGGEINHIKIGIADTGDHIYDSGIFISNFTAGNIPGSGVVVAPPAQCSDKSDTVTGSTQDEYFNLLGGDDTVYAAGGDDIIVAGAGNDVVYGGSGNDELKGDGGDDLLDGGDGLSDIAVYAGASTGYSVVYNAAANSFTITDSNTGLTSEGSDTLTHVEYAKFSDGLFELGINGLTPASTVTTPPSNTPGILTISGIGSVGNILTATLSDPDGVAGTIGYQWQISNDNGSSWSNLSGAVSNTLLLLNDDVGNLIQVTADYVDNGNQAEFPVSASKAIFAPQTGDLVVTLMQLNAPSGTSVINPLTTLIKNAVDLGLSFSAAALDIKTVLGISAEVKLQSYDAYEVLLSVPNDPTALAVEKVAVQVAILTSLSDDDTGINLTLAILNAAANNQTLDLANLNDICSILGIDPLGTLPDSVSVIFDRNKSMSDALADGGDVTNIENEWVDLCGLNDGIASTTIADLSIHLNQAPVGNATALLPAALQGEIYIITSNDLLQGITDPDGDVLAISALSTDNGGDLQDNGDGTWSFIPFADYSGPVELSYTIEDGLGGSITMSQIFVVTMGITNNAPTGEVVIVGELQQSQTLTADSSTLADADGLGALSYQWQADGVDISGATEGSYTLTQDEVGRSITVTVTYTDGFGTLESLPSSPSTAVANVDDVATGILAVTGIAEEGGALVASLTDVVDLDGSTTTSFRWEEYATGKWIALSSQNGATLAIPSDQSYVGKIVRVVASTTDALGGVTEFIGNGQTIVNVNDAPTGTVSIAGTAQQGQTLNATNSLADVDGLGIISYQWQSGGVVINGAVGNSCTLTQAEVGKTITVKASYTDGWGTKESVISAATAQILPLSGLTLTGTAAADLLNGGTANDTLYGLAGNDTLDGGTGLDTMTGGLGDDTYSVDNTGDKVIENVGEGTDLVQVNISTTGGTFTLANNVENATLLNKVAFNLTGNALANILTGNAAANILNGGADADTLIGGAGDDTYIVDAAGDVVIEGTNSGIDLVKVAIAASGGSYTLTDNVENTLLQNTVSFNLNGNALANSLTGNDAANTLTGGGGNDTLTGGQGVDTFVVDSGTDSITDLGNGGADILKVSAGATANATVSVLWTASSATVNNGTANITTNGLAVNLAAVVNGNGYTLTNTGQAAIMTGSALADVLNGGTGKDTLIGGNGDDILNGLNGNDMLTGSAGSDIFQFSTAPGKNNIDVITDFQSGSDKIELLLSLFANVKGTDGVFNAADILIGAGVTKGSFAGNEHLIYNTTTKAIYYDADGGGAGAGVQFATLTGITTLSATDFLVN